MPVGAELGIEWPQPVLEVGLDPGPDPGVAISARRVEWFEAFAVLHERGVVGELLTVELAARSEERILKVPERATIGEPDGVRVVRSREPRSVVSLEELVQALGSRRLSAVGGRRRRRRPEKERRGDSQQHQPSMSH